MDKEPQRRELELKFAISGEQFDSMKSQLPKAKFASGPAVTRTLRSTYFDTSDHILRDNGLSLRIRRSGRDLRQTVKAETGVKGGVSNPVEIEMPVKGRLANLALIPDEAVRDRMQKLVGQDPLHPLFETVVARTTQPLAMPGGGEIELSLDKGVVKTANARREIREAEIELMSGQPEDLLSMLDELFGDRPPQPSRQNKSDVGYRLLLGQEEPRLVPARQALPALKRSADCRSAFASILQTVTAQILHNWTVVMANDDPEGPHQLRVGLRQLRTALKAFKPIIRPGSTFDIEDRLRELAHCVGELRDADVQAIDIVKPVQQHRDWGVPIEPLAELLEHRRAETRLKVRERLAGKEFLKLRIRLALLPALAVREPCMALRRRASKPVQVLSRKSLTKMWRKVAKRARKIEELGIEERHCLRKELKELRYAIEFFAALYPAKQVARLVGRLEGLQDLFGYMNDVAGAERLAQLPVGPSEGDKLAHHALGYVIGWHTARAEDAWKEAHAAWKKLKATRRFWDS